MLTNSTPGTVQAKQSETLPEPGADSACVEKLPGQLPTRNEPAMPPPGDCSCLSRHPCPLSGNYSSDRETVYKPDLSIIEDATT